MAGISEAKAKAAERQGRGYARHLGVSPGSERYDRIVYGTKRSHGWKPSREVKPGRRGRVAAAARNALRKRMVR